MRVRTLLAIVATLGVARAEPPVFDHAKHAAAATKQGLQLACAGCHTGGIDANGERPGKGDHAGCDTAGCHAEDFYGEKSKDGSTLCLLCHENQQPWADMRSLRPFPAKGREGRLFCVNFSHEAHLSPKRVDRRDCLGCHRRDTEDLFVPPPDHAACGKCHAAARKHGSAAFEKIPMSACDACHEPTDDPNLARCTPWQSLQSGGFRRRVKHFSHGKHNTDIRTSDLGPLSCEACHADAASSTDVREIRRLLDGAATMNGSCSSCHNGKLRDPRTNRRVFSTRDERLCSKCHNKGVTRFGDAAPGGH